MHVGGVAAPKKKPLRVNDLQGLSEWLAEWTGLEPATPGVTGRYSNQLNYHSKNLHLKHTATRWRAVEAKVVGAESLELPTYAL